MARSAATVRRRPSAPISAVRAARLHRLVAILNQEPRGRDDLLGLLDIGLRTFYRELELLRRCGIRIKLVDRHYELKVGVAQAEERLPFPDPQLSFAEIAELSQGKGPAARRLADMLASVLTLGESRAQAAPASRKSRTAKKRSRR